jgi:hypothetical protein
MVAWVALTGCEEQHLYKRRQDGKWEKNLLDLENKREEGLIGTDTYTLTTGTELNSEGAPTGSPPDIEPACSAADCTRRERYLSRLPTTLWASSALGVSCQVRSAQLHHGREHVRRPARGCAS